MKATTKGLALGAANVVVIAIGLAVMEGNAELATAVIMVGGVPGLIAGVALGLVAQGMETRPVAIRLTALIAPAIVVVIALADMFGMTAAVPVAAIPTAVAALILERWTRRVVPPPVPPARVV